MLIAKLTILAVYLISIALLVKGLMKAPYMNTDDDLAD